MNNENTDIRLEKQVLGSLIVDSQIIAKYYNMLNIHLFSTPVHQTLYEIVMSTWEKYGGVVDLLILNKELEKTNQSQMTAYTIELASLFISSAHIEFHIMILVQLSVKRDFIQKFSSLLQIAKTPDNDIFDIRDKAFEYFDNLFLDKFIENNRRTELFSDLVEKVQQKFEKIQDGVLTGIKSSLDIINKAFGGWQNSERIVIGSD